jgi:NAD(P)-dependent dehydrogenase (short-subunit alcohol dehydrogenase family)
MRAVTITRAGGPEVYVTALAYAVARRWPDVLSNAVDPGWVPTKMGGPGATSSLD